MFFLWLCKFKLKEIKIIMRSLQRYHSTDKKNTLVSWGKAQNPLKVFANIIITELASYMPIFIKNPLYKTIGIKIGKNAAIAYRVRMDMVFPELISIGDNTIIGYNTTVLTHEFLMHEWRKGHVKIGKNVMIGANCTILAGVSIGDNSVISSMSLVNKSIPPNSFAYGNPVKVRKKK